VLRRKRSYRVWVIGTRVLTVKADFHLTFGACIKLDIFSTVAIIQRFLAAKVERWGTIWKILPQCKELILSLQTVNCFIVV